MRPVRSLALVLSGALAAAAIGVPAHAGTGDTWKVPAQAWITIKGHGYGHGHGMSQYGAEGAARQGLGYAKIVEFYYPGTDWGQATGRVTVLLTGATSNTLEVLARPGLTIKDAATGDRAPLPDNGASRWRIATAPNGDNRVSYKTSRWHGYADLQGAGEFYAGGDPISLVTPDGTRAYRGRLRAAIPTPGSTERDIVNDLTLESYIKGVVPQEIPASWSTEAVRAQAVAARTYAAYEREHPHGSTYQLCDTYSCQVYGGYDAEYPASNKAVDDTRGKILTAGGEPAFTQFGSSSGGWTSAGSVSYLPARQDPYDGWSGNPVHTWCEKVQDDLLERTWPAIGNLTKIVVTRRDGNGDWGGRIVSITLVGSAGRVTVSGDTFRAELGLRSTWVTFRVAPRTAARHESRTDFSVDRLAASRR
ncbi:SpoIID/LytB domain protein [Nocardioides ginsengisegetis]|uniref:SpoIID/LytB domain protein n=1 Tax=Nocardioides ginsengisegetis TaxID=661491 RepID=A0A7W3IXD2_9ACTN|nr:SpoIID/LytB domain-containing protein [Nocardioides ginsengisegetis]MBA8802294.1 SpoIID/LytB domain protein [Nocardioides ginsengisegetis]